MAWRKILDAADTTSDVFFVSQPFTIRAEGTFGGRTFTMESSRHDADLWSPVDLDGQLVATNPSATFGGNPDTDYRVTVSAAGLNVFWIEAYPVQVF